MSVYIETDKAKPISERLFSPHYTDDRFPGSSTLTVFLAPGYETVMQWGNPMIVDQGVEYAHGDRLVEWHGRDDADAAWKKATESVGKGKSALFVEMYLRELLGDPELKLVHISAGVNRSNSWYYRIYGYIPGKGETSD